MYAKAKIAGHPIHPMLVAFPVTFYVTTLLGFFMFQYVNPDLFWYHLALFCNYAGITTALIAAIPGFIDWAFGIPRGVAAKKRGLIHMSLNLGALALFTISAARVWGTWEAPLVDVTGPFFLSLVGALCTFAAGLHGWHLVATHKVGVNMTPDQERIEPVMAMDPIVHEGRPLTRAG